MSKAKITTFSYLLAVLFGVLAYYLLYNSTLALIYGVLNFLMFQLVIFPLYRKNKAYCENIDQFQHFSSSLVMQLTITPSLVEALSSIAQYFEEDVIEALNDDEMPLISKLDYLFQKFPFPLFKVMSKVLELYTNQGGDIVAMSMEVLSQIDHMQVTTRDLNLDNKKKIYDIGLLWVMSLGAVLYLRTLLAVYYDQMIKTNSALIVFVYLMVFSFSLYLLAKTYLQLKI